MKGESTKKVWFYNMEHDGFSLDDKRVKEGNGKGDIPDIIKNFRLKDKEKFEDRKAKCFYVPIEEIEKNDFDLSISKYQMNDEPEIKYEDPKVIKKKILELEEEIIKTLKELDI
jgi:type I restriction enzyme M protein